MCTALVYTVKCTRRRWWQCSVWIFTAKRRYPVELTRWMTFPIDFRKIKLQYTCLCAVAHVQCLIWKSIKMCGRFVFRWQSLCGFAVDCFIGCWISYLKRFQLNWGDSIVYDRFRRNGTQNVPYNPISTLSFNLPMLSLLCTLDIQSLKDDNELKLMFLFSVRSASTAAQRSAKL